MSLQTINLRKLLKIIYLEGQPRISALRADIRDDINRERGGGGEGGDFYAPFWRDAKDHAFGLTDLHATTAGRIEANAGRANLYPQLRDGFLLWWNERRRWTNEPFQQIVAPKTRFLVPGLDLTLKIGSILAVRDGRNADHFIYPYWFPTPVVGDEAGRVGLWALGQSLPNIALDEIRFLDVIRGQPFSTDRNPFRGDERDIFVRRYQAASDQWERLRGEYD